MVWDRNGNTRAGRSSCDGKRRWGWAGAGRSDNPVAAGLMNPCYLSALAAPAIQAASLAGRSAGRLGPGPGPGLGLAFQRGVAAAQVSPQRQSIWPWPSQRKAQNSQCSKGKSRMCWCRVSSTRPGGQPATRLSSWSKASSWLAVIRSRSSVHRHGRCVGPQTRVVAVSWGSTPGLGAKASPGLADLLAPIGKPISSF